MQKYEASILEQSVKTPLAIQAFPIRVLAHVLATPLLIQFPANGLGKTIENAQVLGLCMHMGDLDEVPGCCGHLGSKVKQRKEGRFFSFCNSGFHVNP